MFDKEAEEYAMLNARQYIHNEGIGFCTSEEEIKQAYQQGAELGYNEVKSEAKEIIEGLMRFCRCFAQQHTEDI